MYILRNNFAPCNVLHYAVLYCTVQYCTAVHARGCVRQCTLPVCGSARGGVWQCLQQCATVRQCAAVCAVCAAVCGSAEGSAVVRQCAAVCSCADVRMYQTISL
jgi:hypothetical protein